MRLPVMMNIPSLRSPLRGKTVSRKLAHFDSARTYRPVKKRAHGATLEARFPIAAFCRPMFSDSRAKISATDSVCFSSSPAFILDVTGKNRVNVGRVARHVGGPRDESSVPVYRPNPFRQEL